jgi:hypothetical protein
MKTNWKLTLSARLILLPLSASTYVQASPYTDCADKYQANQNKTGAAFVGSVFTGNFAGAAGSWGAMATAPMTVKVL